MQELATPDPMARRARQVIVLALAATFTATVLLWWHFGTQVFIEAVIAGLAICF